MKIVRNSKDLMQEIQQLKLIGSVGFVPTMGALHQGHLSLVEACKSEAQLCVVSIFVNPKQFNNQEDLENYPSTLNQDLELLQQSEVDVVYVPTVEDVYGDYNGVELDLGRLDVVMEGKNRPGHFKGVVDVVYRFFDIVKPDKAFFGLKDFQQVAVIKKMVSKFDLPIDIVTVSTKRESSGLAMSSRNMRLSSADKERATIIYKSMKLALEWRHFFTVEEVIKKVTEKIDSEGLITEYVAIVDSRTLETETSWSKYSHLCVVAECAGVRLIDNISLV